MAWEQNDGLLVFLSGFFIPFQIEVSCAEIGVCFFTRMNLNRALVHGYSIFVQAEKTINHPEVVITVISIRLHRNHTPELFGGLFVRPERVIAFTEVIVVIPASGAGRYSPFKIADGALKVALFLIAPSNPAQRPVAGWLYLDCPLEGFYSLFEPPRIVINVRQRNMNLRLVRVEDERAITKRDGLPN